MSRHGDAAGGFVVSVELLRDVRQGERLSISYAPSEAHTRERRRVYVHLPPLTTALAPQTGADGKETDRVSAKPAFFSCSNHAEGLSHGVRGLWCVFRLRASKFFDCCCPRCADPSEAGLELGSLVCPQCRSDAHFAHHQSRPEGEGWSHPCR